MALEDLWLQMLLTHSPAFFYGVIIIQKRYIYTFLLKSRNLFTSRWLRGKQFGTIQKNTQSYIQTLLYNKIGTHVETLFLFHSTLTIFSTTFPFIMFIGVASQRILGGCCKYIGRGPGPALGPWKLLGFRCSLVHSSAFPGYRCTKDLPTFFS